MAEERKTVYSAIQPTGCMTLGNYIGAINNWVPMQRDYDCLFAIADLHSLTVRQVPAELRARSLSFFAQFLACGIDPEKSIMYFQSSVPQHAELAWILNCFTYIGEMERMTQFKDKSARNEANINLGLLAYPALMAADILLYRSHFVPVGADQKQHLEFARDVAQRFNNIYGDVFVVPEPFIQREGARIFSLADPTAKMSKSDSNENATVSILDTPDVIMRKFKRAVTDCENRVEYDPERAGISNLVTIYSVFTGESADSIANTFAGKGYGVFKQAVADSVIAKLDPVRERYSDLMNNKDYLVKIATDGQQQASYLANKMLRKVYKKVGIFQL